jgi:alanine-glyoxylate transaminase/serine-glyoxylate transaminase/serine-pyruvate transaminase
MVEPHRAAVVPPSVDNEIGAGLGALAGKVWRIGLMGHACAPKNILLCVGALGAVLGDMGLNVDRGGAMNEVERALADAA